MKKGFKAAALVLSAVLIFSGCAPQGAADRDRNLPNAGTFGTNAGAYEFDTRNTARNGLTGSADRTRGFTTGTGTGAYVNGPRNFGYDGTRIQGISSRLEAEMNQTGAFGAKVLVLGDTVILGVKQDRAADRQGTVGGRTGGMGTRGLGTVDRPGAIGGTFDRPGTLGDRQGPLGGNNYNTTRFGVLGNAANNLTPADTGYGPGGFGNRAGGYADQWFGTGANNWRGAGGALGTLGAGSRVLTVTDQEALRAMDRVQRSLSTDTSFLSPDTISSDIALILSKAQANNGAGTRGGNNNGGAMNNKTGNHR